MAPYGPGVVRMGPSVFWPDIVRPNLSSVFYGCPMEYGRPCEAWPVKTENELTLQRPETRIVSLTGRMAVFLAKIKV